jgi:phage pi2 protein 07
MTVPILKRKNITISKKEYDELQEHIEDLQDTIAYRDVKKKKEQPVAYHVARKKIGLA